MSLDIDLTRGRVAVVKNGALLKEWTPAEGPSDAFVVGVTIGPGSEVTIIPMESPYMIITSDSMRQQAKNQATKQRFESIVTGMSAVAPATSAMPGSNLEDSIGSLGKVEVRSPYEKPRSSTSKRKKHRRQKKQPFFQKRR